MRETERQVSITTSSKASEELNIDSDEEQRLVIDLDASQGSLSGVTDEKVKDITTKADTSTDSALESGLKMKIKRTKNSSTRAEIVRDGGSPVRGSGRSTPRPRRCSRQVNGSSSTASDSPPAEQADPYEFSDKKEEEPKLGVASRARKDKLRGSADGSDSVKRRSVGVETCHQNVGTEPECLGACEPGTNVSLEGIVWQESLSGILVVNVTWRGRSYVGTLMDQAQHTWAPPRLNDSPTAELEPRTPRGRRGRTRVGTLAEAFDQRKLRAKNRRSAGGRMSCPASPRNGDLNRRRNRPVDLELEEVKAKKVRATSSSSTPAEETAASPSELHSDRICCPEENCCKKYNDLNALAYHRAHAHYKSIDDCSPPAAAVQATSQATGQASPQPKVKKDKVLKRKAVRKDKCDSVKSKSLTVASEPSDFTNSESAAVSTAKSTVVVTSGECSSEACTSVCAAPVSPPLTASTVIRTAASTVTVASTVVPVAAVPHSPVTPTGAVAPTLRPVATVAVSSTTAVCTFSAATTVTATPVKSVAITQPKTQSVAPLMVSRADPITVSAGQPKAGAVQATKASAPSPSSKPVQSASPQAKDKKKKRRSKENGSPVKDFAIMSASSAEQSIPSQHSPQLMTSRAGPREVHAKLQGGTISIGPAQPPSAGLSGDGNVSSPAAYSDISDAEDEGRQKTSATPAVGVSSAHPAKAELSFGMFPQFAGSISSSLGQYYGLHQLSQAAAAAEAAGATAQGPVDKPVVSPGNAAPSPGAASKEKKEAINSTDTSRDSQLRRLAYDNANSQPRDALQHEQLLRTEPSYKGYFSFYLEEKRARDKIKDVKATRSPAPSPHQAVPAVDKKTPVKPLVRPNETSRPTAGVKPMQQIIDGNKRPVASAAPIPTPSPAPSPDPAKKSRLEESGPRATTPSGLVYGAAYPLHPATSSSFDPYLHSSVMNFQTYLSPAALQRLPTPDKLGAVSPRDCKPATPASAGPEVSAKSRVDPTCSAAGGTQPSPKPSPPPQRHLHTHHHTHVVQSSYPINPLITDPYTALMATQAAAMASPHPNPYHNPRPPKH